MHDFFHKLNDYVLLARSQQTNLHRLLRSRARWRRTFTALGVIPGMRFFSSNSHTMAKPHSGGFMQVPFVMRKGASTQVYGRVFTTPVAFWGAFWWGSVRDYWLVFRG